MLLNLVPAAWRTRQYEVSKARAATSGPVIVTIPAAVFNLKTVAMPNRRSCDQDEIPPRVPNESEK
jgi:hypothetical protein